MSWKQFDLSNRSDLIEGQKYSFDIHSNGRDHGYEVIGELLYAGPFGVEIMEEDETISMNYPYTVIQRFKKHEVAK